jgi:hypothetical protein
MKVEPEFEPEFNEWDDAEHLTQLAAVLGVLCARRYSSPGEGSERKYLALYHLTRPAVWRERRLEQGRQHALDRADEAAFP